MLYMDKARAIAQGLRQRGAYVGYIRGTTAPRAPRTRHPQASF